MTTVAPAVLEVVPYSPDLWARLEPAWLAALRADAAATAFHSGAWVQCWLATYGGRLRPDGLVWRVGGEPVGACLLSLTRERLGPFPLRRAWLNATGEAEVGSEHNRLLGTPEVRGQMVADIARESMRRRADQLMLTGFDLQQADLLRAAWSRGSRSGYESEDCYVDLAAVRAAGRGYLSTLSGNTREQIRRSTRAYTEQFGAPTVNVATDLAMANAWHEEMVALHEARWQARGQAGSFATATAQAFHRSLRSSCAPPHGPPAQMAATATEAMTTHLRVELVRISFGGETIALLYNLVFRGGVYFFQSGLRYHEGNKFKPGLVAHAMAIQHYLDHGHREYDFLAGEPAAVQYKRSLTKTSRQLLWEEVSAVNAKMGVIAAIRDLRERARRARARLKRRGQS